MNTSRDLPRKRRAKHFSLELLEGRQLLSAGLGSTFAIIPGTVDKVGQLSSIQFKIDPSEFTPGKGGKILLGFDVAADPSSSIKPEIVSIKDSSGRVAATLHHSAYTAAVIKAKNLTNPISSAVLASLPVPPAGHAPGIYTIQVRGDASTTGKYLLGFYLPGDTSGNGVVDQASLQLIRSKLGATSSSSNYNFDADVTRDGKISPIDLKYAASNLGAKTTISPVIDVNLDPATDGPLHSRITNFRNVHFTGTATPNATVTFTEVNNNSAGATTTVDSTGHYSLIVPLGDGPNTFRVTTNDGFGQSISGTISPVTYSTNPPVVVNTPSH